MNRAFGVLEFRAVDEEQRILEGVASTNAEDTYGTILEPRGAKYSLPMPLLWQHDREAPVGHVLSVGVENDRIRVRAQILKIAEAGPLKDMLDRAWQTVKHKLVRGFSVGFQPINQKGNRFTEWDWRELSLVTLPATPGASIELVRSAFADSGKAPSPGASGNTHQTNVVRRRERTVNIIEQIKQHERTRAAKIADRDALHETAVAEGRTLNDQEIEQFDTLEAEIRAIDSTLQRLAITQQDADATAEARAAQQKAAKEKLERAVPINGTNSQAASRARSGVPVVTIRDTADKGIGFARYVMALAVCKGNNYQAAEYAKRTWGDAAGDVRRALEEGLLTRAAVAPGTTSNATFAAPLVPTTFLTEFLDLLRPLTLIGRIPGLFHVPFNVSVPVQTAGGTYKWVGQNQPKPVTNAQYAAATLTFAKASGIIVLTEELVRLSNPSAEAVVREELLRGCTQFLDAQFVDSTVAAVAGVNPASITNGVTGTAASAATMAAARTDIGNRVAALVALGYKVSEIVLLMSESIALNLSLGLNALGGPSFPGMSATGGSLMGIPAIASQGVGNQIVVAHAPSVMIADEGGVEIDVSREASVQLDSAPTNPPDASTVLTSLWQMNLVGLRVDRIITWGKARANSVDRITAVAYAP